MLKLTGNVTDIASFPALAAYQQYPHCIYDEIINHLKELLPRDTLSKSTVNVMLSDLADITPTLLKSVYPFTQSVVNTAKIVEVDIFVFIVILGGLVFCFTTPYPHCLHEAYTTPHIATCSISTKFKISSIRKYCIKHIGIN